MKKENPLTEQEAKERCCNKIADINDEFLSYCDEVERNLKKRHRAYLLLVAIGTAIFTAFVRFVLCNILMC